MIGAVQTDQRAGSWAVLSWLIGGVLMLLIVGVMVELATTAPKTGGLIFLPLQSSGPLLATVVAAGLWAFYAVNPASESTAIIRGLVQWRHWQGLIKTSSSSTSLTSRGIGVAVLVVVALTLINLLGPRWFLRINNVLTIFKLLVPLLVIGLGVYAWSVHLPNHLAALPPSGPTAKASPTGSSFNVISVLTTVTTGGVIYAYLGFQGPLDFAGAVRRDGVGEAARLRRAVYGTVWGSILLYASLAGIVVYIRWRTGSALDSGGSPFTAFAQAVAPGWVGQDLSLLINVDSVLSPAGSALVFTYVLTREVAALSRAHLTHRGLQTSRYSVIAVPGGRLGLRRLFGERLDVYWLILIVDCSLSALALLVFRGNWITLSAVTSVLALVVYATPGVVLTALYRRAPGELRSRLYQVLARSAFIAIAVVFFLAGWADLWPSLATLTACCLVLFALPVVFSGSRWYDAKAYAAKFRQPGQSPSAQSALVLYGFFAALALASLLNQYAWPTHPVTQLCSAVPMAGIAWPTFDRLVKLSVAYMDAHEPFLPKPLDKRRRRH